MADFRFRICNELLDEEDEDSAFIINFTPSTFKKAKEKLLRFLKETFPEFTLGTQEDWDNDNCKNKYFWQWFDDCELCYGDEPEDFDERFERIVGIVNDTEEAFDIYIEEVPENDLIGPLCQVLKE